MALVVNLTEKRVYVYRSGLRIGVATISSGKKGKETPTGVFTILQKDKDHRSNKYDSAPMPYMLRLTWDGVALHAGSVGADSHGCIHLPTEFARLLFNAASTGINVVVSRSASSSPRLVQSGPLSPVDVDTSNEIDFPGLEDGSPWRWEPDREPLGPVLVVVSRRDRQLFVYRHGQEIGRSPIGLDDPSKGGTQAYIVDRSYFPPAIGSDAEHEQLPTWIHIGHGADTAAPAASARQARLPKAFREQLLTLLKPGTLLVVMDSRVSTQRTDGPYVQLVDAKAPSG